MRITKLTIKNFRGIREMELDFHEKMNVLIGINGAGKSSVLDAIATMLSWWNAFWHKMKGPIKWQGENFAISDITNGAQETACTLQLHIEGETKQPQWTVGINRNGQCSSEMDMLLGNEFATLRNTVWKLMDQCLEKDVSPPVLYYPINRTGVVE